MKRVHCESAKTKTTEWQVLEQESRDCREAVGESAGVDSTDKVRHIEMNDQLFVKRMMWADDEVTAASAVRRLNRDEIVHV